MTSPSSTVDQDHLPPVQPGTALPGAKEPEPQEITVDSCNEGVIAKMRSRAVHGLAKYGVSLDRDDLTLLQWLQHAQDEMMDGAAYLEKLIQQEKARLTKLGIAFLVFLSLCLSVQAADPANPVVTKDHYPLPDPIIKDILGRPLTFEEWEACLSKHRKMSDEALGGAYETYLARYASKFPPLPTGNGDISGAIVLWFTPTIIIHPPKPDSQK